jgi:ABC-2 type transport system ATP-binding protein
MSVIEVSGLTKDYGHGRGVFDVSINVEQGECYGFLGPNGAGKTTTIRHLMGFSRPDSGSCHILGLDCRDKAPQLKSGVGYLPGELAFPEDLTGRGFLRYMKNLRRIDSMEYCEKLLDRFELDPTMEIYDMSLGMRRKLAVVTAFMHDPDILILDEPTSGLDPIMQDVFINYILDEKARGKTILLSSHMFHEVDACCDRISIIKEGHIVATFRTEEIQRNDVYIYQVKLSDEGSYKKMLSGGFPVTNSDERHKEVRLSVETGRLAEFIELMSSLGIRDFREIPYTLEDYFMHFYRGEDENS